jgi:RNA polymerase sigma-70 factor, ECF subfamily
MMPSLPSADPERHVRDAFQRGDLRLATTLAIELYGADVLSFLRARLRTQTQVEDAFLQFGEDLWTGIASFRWQSSLRAWMFALARNSATRLGKAAHRKREVPWSEGHEQLLGTIERIRTGTPLYQQTEAKSRMRALREQLDGDQQTLLILRVARHLSWKELAVVMGEVPLDAGETELTRASARMRGRFQAAKAQLRALAEEAGIVTTETGR